MTMSATSMRYSTARSCPTLYYAGYDPGSRIATLYLASEDHLDELPLALSVPSIVGDGLVADLVNTRTTTDPNAPLASLLKKHEFVIEYEGQEHYVGELAEKEGKNPTTAYGVSDRYWSRHNLLLLLTLAAALIPERQFELRVVTALPVTLYRTKENRSLVKKALEGWYPFKFNGRDREVIVKVGAVVMEGIGALIHHGEEVGRQAVIDIGERTIDLVAADGQTPLASLCDGDILGVGQIADELIREVKQRYKRILSSIEAHEQLYAYANNKPFPRLSANQQPIPADEIRSTIDRAIDRVGRAINLYIAQKWNQEDGTVASNFSPVLLIGGGAHYFEQTIRTLILLVNLPENPEDANPRGYLDLALSLEDVKATVWERN
jgi:actin-like protein/actin family MreB-like protein